MCDLQELAQGIQELREIFEKYMKLFREGLDHIESQLEEES